MGMNGNTQNFAERLQDAYGAEHGIFCMKRRVWVNDRGHAIGQDHHRAKLADADIQMIVELRDAGLSWREIAGKFDDVPGGVSIRHVRNAYHGIRRGHTAVRTKLVGKG